MLSTVNVAEIKSGVTTAGYYILRNPQTVELAAAARVEYFESFKQFPLRAGGFRYGDLLAGPIRKKNISSANGLGEAYAQVLQTMYYPKDNQFSAISEMFRLMVELRNVLTGNAPDYGDRPEAEGFWNARRVHHYPQGGGFMVVHEDTHFPKLLGEGKFLQMLYLLSQKGGDFTSGGGVITDWQGTLIDIEEAGGFGSIILYDGRIKHGVLDVDPHETFSFDAPNGRLAAIANLYEYRGM